jgi:Flp pilus assembly protein TadD
MYNSFTAAVEHHTAGRFAEAEQIYREILAAEPDNPDALHLLGMLAHDTGDSETALGLIGRALSLNPFVCHYHSNLGNVFQSLGRYSEALLCYEEAIRLARDMPEPHNNMGNALRHLGRYEEAARCFLEAIRLRPDYFQAFRNLGDTLSAAAMYEDAAACYQQALRLGPDIPETHVALAYAWMTAGNLKDGWREYEWRWKTAHAPVIDFAQPRWDGSPLEGKTILLWAEQGLGDTLHFIRYATLAAEAGGRVVVECQSGLAELVETVAGVQRAIVYGNPLPEFAVQAPLQSLPAICGTTLETIPARVPYLSVRPEWRARWQGRTGGAGGLKAGLVWAGNPLNPNDANRSIPSRCFAPWKELPGIRWFSLQKNPPGALPPLAIDDLSAEILDFRDTAALVEQLDLVISADTAVAHLAGALGKPVWTLLPFAPDYRWMIGRDDSPWYPTMRLFRQPVPGDWDSVIRAAGEALAG